MFDECQDYSVQDVGCYCIDNEQAQQFPLHGELQRHQPRKVAGDPVDRGEQKEQQKQCLKRHSCHEPFVSPEALQALTVTTVVAAAHAYANIVALSS